MSTNLIATTSDGGFSTTGNITVGESIIVGGGITGTGASPAPSLSGFSSLSAITLTTSSHVNIGGNLDVDGPGRIGGNLTVVGNIDFSGGGSINQITSANGVFTGDAQGVGALYAGTPGYTPVPASIAQYTGDANEYLQLNAQNINHGNTASIEYVITGDIGTDLTDYLDIGMSGSGWDGTQENSLGSAAGPLDAWMYVQGGSGGGDLILGTTTSGKKIKFVAGGPGAANIVANVTSQGINSKAIYTNNYYYANGDPLPLVSGSSSVSTTGNISGGNIIGTALIGNGSQITYISGSSVNGAVANATYATTAGTAYSVAVANVSGIGNIATLNLNGSSSQVLYGNGTFGTVASGGTDYSNSNVTSLLASFGSNTITTTGNISVGNVTAVGSITTTGYFVSGNQATGGFQLGNSNSRLKAGGSNSYMTMGQNPAIYPDTAASVNAGVLIGGSGYLLATNGARVLTLNSDSSVTVTGNITQTNPGMGISTTGTFTRSGAVSATAWTTAGVGMKIPTATYTDTSTASGTQTSSYIHSMAAPALAFSNAVTVTNAATLFVAAPTAGSNATLTNPYAILANGNVQVNGNISTTGNITAANFSGNISITGNVTGTSSNVTLVAGAYSTTFDNTGTATLPGNLTIGGIAPGYAANRPAFRVYGSGASYVQTTANVNLKGATLAVDYNQGSYFNATTGIFTAPVAGIYQTTLVARVSTNNGLNQIAILKNFSQTGSNVICFWETDTNTGTASHFGTSGATRLAAGDKLTANILAGNVNFDGNDSWTVTYIG